MLERVRGSEGFNCNNSCREAKFVRSDLISGEGGMRGDGTYEARFMV